VSLPRLDRPRATRAPKPETSTTTTIPRRRASPSVVNVGNYASKARRIGIAMRPRRAPSARLGSSHPVATLQTIRCAGLAIRDRTPHPLQARTNAKRARSDARMTMAINGHHAKNVHRGLSPRTPSTSSSPRMLRGACRAAPALGTTMRVLALCAYVVIPARSTRATVVPKVAPTAHQEIGQRMPGARVAMGVP
jgi:hypothetical protein